MTRLPLIYYQHRHKIKFYFIRIKIQGICGTKECILEFPSVINETKESREIHFKSGLLFVAEFLFAASGLITHKF